MTRKILRYHFRIIPNHELRISQYEENGWEIYGYSDYNSEGFPWKVELRKPVYEEKIVMYGCGTSESK